MFIIPKPQKLVFFEGQYVFQELITSEKSLNKIKKDTDFFGIDIKKGTEENLFLFEDATFGDEEYEISINQGGISLIAATEVGFFRALSSLKQIIAQAENGALPYLNIHDFPDIEKRGIMLYQNSSCIYTMDTIYNIVDHMAEMKYNMLQLYFDTFVFEYDSFRRHLDDKVYYTKEDIHNLDAYCKVRHIELMANVETFGHLSQLLACDEYKHLGISRDDNLPAFTINPLLDESFEVIKTLLDDLLPHFSSSFVNIGMDETMGLGEGETKEYCDTFGKDTLFIEFLTKVSGHIKSKHRKRSMIWGDMMARAPLSIDRIPKDVIFVDWGYEPGHKFDRNAIECQKAGLDYYVAPGTHNWFTITGRTDVMVQNVYFAAESARQYGAKGFLLTDWMPSCEPSLGMLAYCMGAAFSWNSGYGQNVAECENEANCMFRSHVIADVLKYCDRFIYHAEEGSLADLVYRMGNYWFLEQPASAAIWNGTMLEKEFSDRDVSDYLPMTEGQLKRIQRYIQEIKEELALCRLSGKDAELVMCECNAACDKVLFAVETVKSKLKNGGMAKNVEFETDELMKKLEIIEKAHLKMTYDSQWVKKIKDLRSI